MDRTLRLVLAALTVAVSGGATAQLNYPEKPIRLVVGFPPGGGADIAARVLAQKLSEAWGQPVVTENVPGATGNIAAERVAKAAPDGYTLMLAGSGALTVNPSLYGKLAFDPVRDFAPISLVVVNPNVLVVHPAVAAKNVQDLVALAKAQPGKLDYASGGNGTSHHLAGELFKTMAAIDIVHVPYKGAAPAILDLRSGRVTMMFANVAGVLPLVREGKLQAFAVTTATRLPAVPELPTMAESGFPGFEVAAWFGLVAPAGTPAPVIGKLHLETVRTLANSEVRSKLADVGLEPIGSSPEEFGRTIRSELPRWAQLIRASGAKLD